MREYTYLFRVPGPGKIECHALELPTVLGRGATWHGAFRGAKLATANAVSLMLARRQTPPLPNRVGERSVNLRVGFTAEEKFRLTSLAAREGFRSVSDYVRSAALRRTA